MIKHRRWRIEVGKGSPFVEAVYSVVALLSLWIETGFYNWLVNSLNKKKVRYQRGMDRKEH
jgi:hypothetical protein